MNIKNNLTTKRKIPRIRFSNFNDEWNETNLGNFSTINPNNNQLKDVFYYIDLESVKSGILMNITEIERRNAPSRAQRVLQKYDVLFQAVRPYQMNNYFFDLDGDYVASTGYAQLRTKQNPKYLYYFLHTSKFVNKVVRYSTGTNYPAINSSDLKKLNILFPNIEEQQKIASFLSSVDEWIENLRLQKESLEKYKKGIMQKIFSQQIRFKDENGKDFPKWENTNVNKLVDNIGGCPLEKYVSKEGKYNFISIGNYSTDGKYIDNGQKIVLNDQTKFKLLNKNNLVMVLNDKTKAGDIIGSTILIDESNKYIYNQRSERLICKRHCNPLFIWQLFNSKIFRKKIFSISQGGTQIYVNFSNVKKIDLSIPSLLEQTKIAEFLSTIDNLINLKAIYIKKAEQWKKGLLQKLFI